MSGTFIDLTVYEQQIRTLLADGVARFSREHPEVTVSMLVLDYSGLNPYVMVALDTPGHSDAHVGKYLQHGPAFYGDDEYGKFCNSPWDCEYKLADFRFENFPDLYDANPHLSFQSPSGDISQVDLEKDGDEAINEVMFRFLLPIVKSYSGYRLLKRAPVFRLGVHMQDSRFAEFWPAT